MPVPGGLEAYRPAFRYLLLDESAHAGAPLPEQRNLAGALFQLENSRRPEDVQAVIERLLEWLHTPEQRDLRRAFSVWLGRVLIPGRFGGAEMPPTNDLQEMEAMLAERVKEWQQEWKEEGLEEGRQEGMQQGEAALLLRQVERKFGPEVAEAHRGKIDSADPETLLEWSERILTAETVAELFR